MAKLFVCILVALSFTAQAELNRDPVGETADYILDNSRARTTSMIKKGKVKAEVLEYVADAEDGPAYRTRLNYDLTISWVGRKQGQEDILAPAQYFQPEFIETLRAEKKMDLGNFKLKHLGFATVSTKSGKQYADCDKVFIYDIDTGSAIWSIFLAQAMQQVAANLGVTYEEIEDLEVLVHAKEGIPVLGAVKIDLSGKARGYAFKAGFDLVD